MSKDLKISIESNPTSPEISPRGPMSSQYLVPVDIDLNLPSIIQKPRQKVFFRDSPVFGTAGAASLASSDVIASPLATSHASQVSTPHSTCSSLDEVELDSTEIKSDKKEIKDLSKHPLKIEPSMKGISPHGPSKKSPRFLQNPTSSHPADPAASLLNPNVDVIASADATPPELKNY